MERRFITWTTRRRRRCHKRSSTRSWRTRHRPRANVLRGVHALAEAATQAYEPARGDVARYIGAAAPQEVVFTSGTTGGINLLAHSLGESLGAGDEIVLSLLEHHSNIVPWQMLRDRRGVALRFLPVTSEGRIDTSALEHFVTPRTRLISLGHVSNVTGAELDVGAVVEAARAVGALVALDGAQRAAHGPFDVQALGVDFYAFSSHKMFGPNGVGVLWGRGAALAELPPFLGGGEMIARVTPDETTYARPPHRFEAGTPPIAQAVGLGAAVRWIEATDSAAGAAHMRGLALRIGRRPVGAWKPRTPRRAGRLPGALSRGFVSDRRRPSARSMSDSRWTWRGPTRRAPLRAALHGSSRRHRDDARELGALQR